MDKPNSQSPAWLDVAASLAGLAASLGLGYLAVSQRLPPSPAPASTSAADSLGPPPALEGCIMEREGYWKGRIVGSSSLDVDWRGTELSCAGNARPDGRGLRLFFAGHPQPGEDRLLLVLGIAASVSDLAGHEHPVSLTLIDEASSQFFHSTAGRCFTRVRDVAPVAGTPGTFRVEGDLYCAGAIASVSGETSVTLGDISYAGRVTLDAG